MTCTRSPSGTLYRPGGSRRHVGGTRTAAVKPWKSSRPGREPLHTMHVGRDVESPKIRGIRRAISHHLHPGPKPASSEMLNVYLRPQLSRWLPAVVRNRYGRISEICDSHSLVTFNHCRSCFCAINFRYSTSLIVLKPLSISMSSFGELVFSDWTNITRVLEPFPFKPG
jgi:hypothetical protein